MCAAASSWLCTAGEADPLGLTCFFDALGDFFACFASIGFAGVVCGMGEWKAVIGTSFLKSRAGY